MKKFSLYGGEVEVEFRPDSRFRYVVTDPVKGMKEARVRGVTTLIGDILDKPGLRLWARDEMAKSAFGMSMSEGKPTYNEKSALLKTNTAYTDKDIQAILDKSFDAYTVLKDKGSDIGTMTHDYVERYLTQGFASLGSIVEEYPDVPDEYKRSVVNAVNTFAEWWEGLPDAKLIGVENIIYSRNYQYAGTYDIKAIIDGKLMMLDIKTTNRSPYAPLGIYPEYFMQLGAYMLADSESTGDTFQDCGVINVGKDGKLSIATTSDLGMNVFDCIEPFTRGVEIHDWIGRTSALTKDNKLVSSLMVGSELF